MAAPRPLSHGNAPHSPHHEALAVRGGEGEGEEEEDEEELEWRARMKSADAFRGYQVG